MQPQERVVVDDRALIGWHMLPASDRARIIEGLGDLADLAPENYPAGQVERWWPGRNLFAYHLPFSEDEMLVFFYPQDGRLHIDSLAPRERFEASPARKA